MRGNTLEAELWSHPSRGSLALAKIRATLRRLSLTNIHVRYEALGTTKDLVVPDPSPPLRANNLWQTTCFELFLRGHDRVDYREFNFAPSGQFAAYEFRAYRDGMTQANLPGPPIITTQLETHSLVVDVRLSLDLPDEPYSLSMAAVVEERGIGNSYWAANHAGERPDFHHPACFVLELPPP